MVSILIGLTIVVSSILFVFNSLVMHYYGIDYLTHTLVMAAPLVFILYYLGVKINHRYPRIALLLKTLGVYLAVALSFEFLLTATQYTPFPLIDRQLLALDRLLGFHTLAVLDWVRQHAFWHNIFKIAYISIPLQLYITPFLLAILNEKRALNSFFIYALLSGLITCIFYYFFPSTDPANVLHSSYFLPSQRDTYIKYYEMRDHFPITTGLGGSISCPSLHVIWAVMLTYPWRNRKYLFYPLLILNIFAIFATLALGWHFLIDVIAGFIVAGITFYYAEKWSDGNAGQDKAPFLSADQ